MKIIFLDFDGVLNSETFFVYRRDKKWFRNKRKKINKLIRRNMDKDRKIKSSIITSKYINSTCELDKKCIRHLNKIIKYTNAKIVVSSSWRICRKLSELKYILKINGFKGKVIGTTPIFHTARGNEIQSWLDNTKLKVDKFIILDDETDMVHLMPHLIQTSWEKTGLTNEHANEAIKRLNERENSLE